MAPSDEVPIYLIKLLLSDKSSTPCTNIETISKNDSLGAKQKCVVWDSNSKM